MKLFLDYLSEAVASPRIPHPEDSIFDGSSSAAAYLQALKNIAADPKGITIKWDGGIALVFGTDPNGRFFINDKYMPDAFYAHSPADWQKYDTQIKKSRTARPDLYDKLAVFWNGLKQLVSQAPGVYKGDLMFAHQLEPVNNEFVFKPVTVEYRVPVGSALGQLIAGRQALIVAHQYNNATWQGKPMSNSVVSVISPGMGIDFRIKPPNALIAAAEKTVRSLGNAADQFRAGMPKTYSDLLQRYLNQKITKQTNADLGDWLSTNAKPAQLKFLLGDNQDGYLYQNKAGLDALFAIWNAISALKENLAQQLETQVVGIKQIVNGQPQGEGFVYPSIQGLVKLVQRSGFGAAHFSGYNSEKK
jgi:hypothetical protein